MHAVTLFTALLLPLLVSTAPTNPPTRDIKVAKTNLPDFADPAISKFGDTWYAFGTNDKARNVQVATSKDFRSWTKQSSDALPTVGKWADQKTRQVWAPDVIINDAGKYIMYYSAKLPGIKRHCVGVAVASTPLGPYQPHDNVLFCPSDKGGAIDSSGFRDVDNKRYVVYKIDGNNVGHGGNCGNSVAPIVPTPLMLQAVEGDGFTKKGMPIQILDRSAADGPLIEAPSITRTASGKYVLFFSSNCFASKWYDIGYAIADKITGPYIKAGPLAVTGTSGLYAPGGLDVAPDGQHVVFHAGEVGRRAMYTAEISVDTKRRIVYA